MMIVGSMHPAPWCPDVTPERPRISSPGSLTHPRMSSPGAGAAKRCRNRGNAISLRSAQHQRHQTGVGACAYQADSHYKTLQNATRNTTTGALLLWLWIEQYDSAVGGKGILVTSVCLHLCVIGRVCKNLLLLALVGFLCKLCIKRWTQLRRRALWTRRWSSQPL